MIAAELVRTDNINNEIPEATEVGVLDDEVAATGLAVALLLLSKCETLDKLPSFPLSLQWHLASGDGKSPGGWREQSSKQRL